MLKVRQYRELNEVVEGGIFDRMIQHISIISDLDPNEVAEYRPKQIIEEYNKLSPLITVSERYSNTIELDGKKLTFIPFEKLKLGQFIDLEELASKHQIANAHKIAALLYLETTEGGIYEDTIESYANVNVNKRAELIDELPIQSIYGAVNKYLSFRQKFFSSYEIFRDPFEGVKVDELDEEEKAIYNEEMKERNKNADNQWLVLLNILTGGDLTKFNLTLDTNLFLAFNQLSYINSTK